MKTFTLTAEHLALLRRANVDWHDMEFGAPCIDGKRPYGNSDVIRDVAEIVGIPSAKDDNGEVYFPVGTDARCTRLHKETDTALQIVLTTGSFVPGEYVCSDYGTDWKPK